MRVDHIHNRIDKQSSYREFIETIRKKVLSFHRENLSQEGLSTWLEEVREQWQHFANNHLAIESAVTKITSEEKREVHQRSYYKKEIYTDTYHCYLDTVMTLTSLAEKIADRNSSRAASPGTLTNLSCNGFMGARLPRLDIPKYDGTLSKWLSFKGMFLSFVVNDPRLSPSIKLQYLKNSLIGSAAEILENTEIVDDNFQPAWDAVVSRYENPRLLIYSSLSSLYLLRKMTRECGSELEKLFNSTMQEIRTLKMLKEPIDQWDSILVFLTIQKLDSESIKAWEHEIGSSKQSPTWKRFQEFLEKRIQTLKAYEHSQASKSHSHSRSSYARVHFTGKTNEFSRDRAKCALCSGEHHIQKCSRYTSATISHRRDLVNKHRLCYNCLGKHPFARCQSQKRCLKCAKAHHTSLHFSASSNKGENSGTNSASRDMPTSGEKQVTHAHAISSKTVFLPTALIQIINQHETKLQVRALLDQGSEISLVSENLIQRLNIPRQSCSLSLNTINNKTSKTRGSANLLLQPHFESEFKFTINAVILPKLTSLIPNEYVGEDQVPHLKGLQLADPSFNKPGPIDIIIGSDFFADLLRGPIIKGPRQSPAAQLTSLGWIVSGPSPQKHQPKLSNVHHYSIDDDLHQCLEKFWHQEEIPRTSPSMLSIKDQECEDHFNTTHQRDSTGRYIVRLPFNSAKNQLGDSMQSAMRMLHNLENRFKIKTEFRQAYQSFLNEYHSLGHMKETSSIDNHQTSAFYLPHHGVIRESSSTTKLRVVFNGSCRTSNGLPLNQVLHTGAKLQVDLIDVLMWFRKFKYVFSADIEKMYRQIRVHEDDWDYQRILWKEGERIIKYNLTTVTYGLACAPFLALRTILQLIKDEETNFPQAIDTLTHGRYVDDVFGGANTLTKAQEIAYQVNQLCMAGQFPLRKWVSNHPDVITDIPAEHKLKSSTLQLNDNIIPALGLTWNSNSDLFCFKIPPNIMDSSKITKRSILSKIAQFFDPAGFLSPIFIRFKIFMQDLWKIKLNWDDQLGEQQQTTWQQLLQSLDGLNNINIPRWIGITETEQLQIHGYCDASQSAMAAVVYIRIQSPNQPVTTSLLCSKTKVSPIKKMTIPRLELSSAVILTKLVSYCIKKLNLESIPCYLWTDSSIVCTWLNEHPSKWKDFVHNRVYFIQDQLPSAMWRHVPGQMNPADCATRGLAATELQNYKTWWNGPAWLIQDSTDWPSQSISRIENSTILERRPLKVHTTQIIHNELLHRFSLLTSLLRTTAICKRAIQRLRGNQDISLRTPITPEEEDAAASIWIKYVQSVYFKEELNLLTFHQNLPKSSPLINLMPFIDQDGLLRVGGRLKNSTLPFSTKHPCIIPRCSAFTTLLIRNAHSRTLHGSTQETLIYLRHKYWILGGRAPVRSFILKCVQCTRYRRSAAQTLIGQLPATRVTPARAFLHTGIDYAGPVFLKAWKGRCNKSHKAWIAVFVCYTTSAIHLDVVSDYTAEAFLAAYRRFTARRGICSTLNSDCGTNFKGADKELSKLFHASSKELNHLASIIANDGTKWIFNPPASPHFGGKWEAAVKSMKYHLRRVIGDTSLTFEEMTTLLTQIEAVLNSRPLCPLTNDIDDLDALTPGHFLIGHSLNLMPEPNLEHLQIGRLSRWQHLCQMLQSFWRKWTQEYLQRHQAVYKWTSSSNPIIRGSLVIIQDERYPPAKWPLGRVTEVYPGKDGITRVAQIKTSNGVTTRPITKLCLLPVESSETDHSLPASAKAGGNV